MTHVKPDSPRKFRMRDTRGNRRTVKRIMRSQEQGLFDATGFECGSHGTIGAAIAERDRWMIQEGVNAGDPWFLERFDYWVLLDGCDCDEERP